MRVVADEVSLEAAAVPSGGEEIQRTLTRRELEEKNTSPRCT